MFYLLNRIHTRRRWIGRLMVLAMMVSGCRAATGGEPSAPTAPAVTATPPVNPTQPGSVPSETPYRATPVAESPAAGICASVDNDVVEAQIYPDVPDPRCVKVRASQKLTLYNQTSGPIEFTLGQFNAHIEPGQAHTIDRPFGDYLAPGVHRVLALPYSGPELWLEGDSTRYYNAEGNFSLALPDGWEVFEPLTGGNDPDRAYTLYILGPDPAPGGPGNSTIAIADSTQWTPEQFAQAQCSTCPANPFEDVMLGGTPARRTQVGGGGVPFTITWYFVENNGQLIALAIHDPETLEPLEDVIQSIRFE